MRYDRAEAEAGLEYPLDFGPEELNDAAACHRSIREGYRDWMTIRESDYYAGFIRSRLKRVLPDSARMIDWVFEEARHEAVPEACRRQGLMRDEDEGATTRFPCPCCGFITLEDRAHYDICPVCFWEDDGQDDEHADEVWGGPNHSLSLTAARENFARIGASDQRRLLFVRPPWPAEFPAAIPRTTRSKEP